LTDPTEFKTACLKAHQTLAEREARYGEMVSSWEEIGELADSLAAETDTPGQRAVLILIAAKLVRRKHSPEEPDHLIDACGYLGILAKIEDSFAGPARAAVIGAAEAADLWDQARRTKSEAELDQRDQNQRARDTRCITCGSIGHTTCFPPQNYDNGAPDMPHQAGPDGLTVGQ